MAALPNARIPVLGAIGSRGVGKTTLLQALLKQFSAQSLRVGVVKQARNDFDVDIPGKDSYVLRKAGVEQLLLASKRKLALIMEHPGAGDPVLDDLLAELDQKALDLILVEGFKNAAFAKIELYRGAGAPSYPSDPHIIALVTDRAVRAPIPTLNINDPPAVAEFVLAWRAREIES